MKHCQICFQSNFLPWQRKEDMLTRILPSPSPVHRWVMRKDLVVCASCDSLKQNKLRRHLETKHPKDKRYKDKPIEFFRQKLVNCHAQQSFFSKAASVPANAQLASYKAAYRVAQCKKPHTIAEELLLPCAMDMVSTMLDDSACSQNFK